MAVTQPLGKINTTQCKLDVTCIQQNQPCSIYRVQHMLGLHNPMKEVVCRILLMYSVAHPTNIPCTQPTY